MALNFDTHILEIPCPHCSYRIKQQIGRLKNNPTLTCNSCHEAFRVDAKELRSGLAKAEKSIESLKTKLRGILK